MCIETLPKEKVCLNKTILMVLKSIEKGESKLTKLLKNESTPKI